MGTRDRIGSILVKAKVSWRSSSNNAYMTGIVVRDRGNGTYDIDRGGEDIVERGWRAVL